MTQKNQQMVTIKKKKTKKKRSLTDEYSIVFIYQKSWVKKLENLTFEFQFVDVLGYFINGRRIWIRFATWFDTAFL